MRKILQKFINLNFFQQDDRFLLIILAIFVGICSGFAAILLDFLLEQMHHLYSYIKDGSFVFLVPALGAILSSLFLNNFLKEAAGHGVPEVIYSVSRYGGLLRFRSSFSRIISSALTIGSGGSAGPEAPVVMSGAAIGSNIGSFLKLDDKQRVCLVGCGTAGAIAAIFNAPMAGLVFTMEVILDKWRTKNIIPIAISAVSGAMITQLIMGNRVIFSHQSFTNNFTDTLVSGGLGLVSAIFSIFLYFSLSRSYAFFGNRKKIPIWLKAGIGGCIVGIMGLFLPDILSKGYHPIKAMVNNTYSASFFIVFLACIVKVIATSFTLGSGGSGGIFAPCLVIGSFLGVSYYKFMIFFFPTLNIANEGYYALLGMAGILSGVLHAPLTGIFLILEITASYNVMLPLVVVSVMSTSLAHYIFSHSFYMKDLIVSKSLLREGTDLRVLSDMDIREVLEEDCIVINEDMVLYDFVREKIKYSKRNLFPVEDSATGKFVGLLDFSDIKEYIFDSILCKNTLVSQVMRKDIYKATIDENLNEILSAMDDKKLFSVPITYNGRFIGMISKATLLDKYRTELLLQD